MLKATLRKIIEGQLAALGGDNFQDMCDRLCLKIYPDDYTPVRAGGPKGVRSPCFARTIVGAAQRRHDR